MSEINLFKHLGGIVKEESDKISFTVQRVGEELVVYIVPTLKGKKVPFNIKGSPAELDEHFIDELAKPVAKIEGFYSNADTAEMTDAGEEENAGTDGTKPKKASSKKAAKPAAKGKGKAKPDEKTEPASNTVTVDGKDATTNSVMDEKESNEEAAFQKKGEFDILMEKGQNHFKEREYEPAERKFIDALKLFPEDKIALAKYHEAKQYVDRLIDAGLIDDEEFIAKRKEEQNGIPSK